MTRLAPRKRCSLLLSCSERAWLEEAAAGAGEIGWSWPRLVRETVGEYRWIAAHRQQGDDLGGLQRRIGAVVGLKFIHGAGEGDVHGDAADLGFQGEIEDRLDAGGIGEADIAAIDGVLVPEHLHLARIHRDGPQQQRLAGRAAQPQVDLRLHIAGKRGLELERLGALATRTSNCMPRR